MRRALVVAVFLAVVAGCQLPPEQVPLKPLPDDGIPEGYSDLVKRARLQAGSANIAFYENKWTDLRNAAEGLQKTSAFLTKASAVPLRHKDTLPVESGDLAKEAARLKDAAGAEDVKKATESMQKIQLMVRQLGIQD
jgi:hypothetical protein